MLLRGCALPLDQPPCQEASLTSSVSLVSEARRPSEAALPTREHSSGAQSFETIINTEDLAYVDQSGAQNRPTWRTAVDRKRMKAADCSRLHRQSTEAPNVMGLTQTALRKQVTQRQEQKAFFGPSKTRQMQDAAQVALDTISETTQVSKKGRMHRWLRKAF